MCSRPSPKPRNGEDRDVKLGVGRRSDDAGSGVENSRWVKTTIESQIKEQYIVKMRDQQFCVKL